MGIVGPGGGLTEEEVKAIAKKEIEEGGGGPPTGKAGGSLSGEYPNPAVAANAVTEAMLVAAVITKLNEKGKEGPEGKEGPAGKEGKEGPAGKEGKEGPAGKEGKEGPAANVFSAVVEPNTARVSGTATEPSATKPTGVILAVRAGEAAPTTLEIGIGATIVYTQKDKLTEAGVTQYFFFIVPAGKTWKYTSSAVKPEATSTYVQ